MLKKCVWYVTILFQNELECGIIHCFHDNPGRALPTRRRGPHPGGRMVDRADKPKARILVIDDDASVRDSMVDALAGEGYDCVGAEDGRLGLARVADTRVHLIIVDILLPKLSGFELVATLRSDPATRLIPVVVVVKMTVGHGHEPVSVASRTHTI